MTWQFFFFFAGILALWAGFILGAVKWMLDQRFGDVAALVRSTTSDLARVRDELATFKAEVARDYIRHEQWVRQMTVSDAKIDLWAGMFERAITEIRGIVYAQRAQ